MIIVYISLIITGITLCYLWTKLVSFLIIRNKHLNPYIEAHKIKNQNDKDYDKYLKWFSKNGNGVPFDKIMTKSDKKADEIIRKELYKK